MKLKEMPDYDLLRDEEFLKIQELNAERTLERRRSVEDVTDDLVDKGIPGIETEVKTFIASERNNLRRIISLEEDQKGEEREYTGGKRATLGPDAVQSKKLLKAEDTAREDEVLRRYLKNLHKMEERRYRNENVISFFADVNFDTRPSIFDVAICEPYLTSFSGPVLEKQIKAYEKSKKEIERKHLEPNGKSNGSSASPDLGNDGPVEPSPAPSIEQASGESGRFKQNFLGLYTLFWMILALLIIKGLIDYCQVNGTNLRDVRLLQLFVCDLKVCIPIDILMYLSTYFAVFIQWLCKRGIISWRTTGKYMAVGYEVAFFFGWYYVILNVGNMEWMARIFLYLHSVEFLMKIHSYTFYNGYLWNITWELNYSVRALAKYKDKDVGDGPKGTKGTTNNVLDTLKRSRDFCESELNSLPISPDSKLKRFPDNVSVENFFMFTMFPTLVYQFDYPRTKHIRWRYVAEKICAILGCMFILLAVAQLYMLPPISRALEMREHDWPSLTARTIEWFYLFAETAPAVTFAYMLVFYMIWDAILNLLGELTCFADRYFYGDWWNCVTWSEFSRIWNVPVHKFLLRHVYHGSLNKWKLSKLQATLFTFVISAVFHEFGMYLLLRRLRPYMSLFQLLQLPMTMVSDTKFFKEKQLLKNLLFCVCMCSGPTVMTTLYVMY